MLKIKVGEKYLAEVVMVRVSKETFDEGLYDYSVHEPLEVCYFLSGNGVYDIEGTEYEIKPGSVFLIYGGEKHKILKVFEDMEYVDLWIYTDELLGEEYSHEKGFAAISKNLTSYCNIIDDEFESYNEVVSLLNNIVKEIETEQFGYSLMVAGYVQNLTILIVRDINDMVIRNSQGSTKQSQIIEESVRYIMDHISNNFTLDELARRGCLNRKYYGTLFKEIMGVSPWNFILEQKIRFSCIRLRNSSDSILTIAESCGFNTIANFNKTFKKYMNMTPREYRKKYIGKKDETIEP